MIIEVGKKYRRRDGVTVYIDELISHDHIENVLVFKDSDYTTYFENGRYWYDGYPSRYDLIDEVNDDY